MKLDLFKLTEITQATDTEYNEEDRVAFLAEREKEGIHVIAAKPKVLQIDVDDFEKYASSRVDNLKALFNNGAIEVFKKESKTPGHLHVYVLMFKEIDPLQRCWMQAYCGSDIVRERMNQRRIVDNFTKPVVFFEKDVSDLPLWAL